jgi:GNAT superfamily N-acetyltransferase
MAGPARPVAGFAVEKLGSRHDRAGFTCGVPDLDRYLHRQASQDARRAVTAPFVLAAPDGGIAGYYTLSSASIELTALPDDLIARLPRYPDIPATLIGRLAVATRYRGQGFGFFLLMDALARAHASEVASAMVLVDAKDDSAAAFYRHAGFIPLPSQPLRLFLPMGTIRKLLAP